jgi:hypothetical protein
MALGGIELPQSGEWDDLDIDGAHFPDFWAQAPPIPDNDMAFFLVEDASNQLSEIDEDYGFSLNFPDDPIPASDPLLVEDGDTQLEDVDEDYGFHLYPLADDNDVGLAAYFQDQADDPEDEDYGFSNYPLPEDVQSDQVFVVDGNTREDDVGDEAFGFEFDQAIAELVIESNQVFVECSDNQLPTPEDDEAFAFSIDPTPDDVLPPFVPSVGSGSGTNLANARSRRCRQSWRPVRRITLLILERNCTGSLKRLNQRHCRLHRLPRFRR